MRDPKAIIMEVWKWLPAFRAVAENESVTKAAKSLNVSPPAVSRALRHIEESLGRELFDRRGRKLTLNPDGRSLLNVLRDVEARLHAEIARLAGAEASGSVRLGAFGQFGAFVLIPATAALAKDFPDIDISISHVDPEPAVEQVEGRSLDLYLGVNVVVGEPLRYEVLARLEMAIFAGEGHALHGCEPTTDAWRQHGFVVQRRPTLMRSVWPSQQERSITLRTDSHSLALQACLEGGHLMVMERAVARPLVAEGRLTEIRADFLERANLVLVRHGHRGHDAKLDMVAAVIRRVVAERFDASSTAE